MAGGELTPPSRVAFSNWGMFADNLWDAEIVPGREFIRSRESDLDSAVAMYWDPSALAPGEVRHYVTYYGLGGITLAPGKLALGITAPAEVGLSSDGTAPFLAVAYVHNTGEGPAHDLVARLDLPSGFKLAGGQSNTHSIGDLEPGQTAQVAWQVVGRVCGRADLAVSVSAKNADANAVSREIQVLGPPRLLASIRRVEALQVRDERLYPWPARVSVRVENTGGSDANWVKVRLDSLGDFALSGGDHRELLIGSVQPNQGQDISWMLGRTEAVRAEDSCVRHCPERGAFSFERIHTSAPAQTESVDQAREGTRQGRRHRAGGCDAHQYRRRRFVQA